MSTVYPELEKEQGTGIVAAGPPPEVLAFTDTTSATIIKADEQRIAAEAVIFASDGPRYPGVGNT
jgi:hypothetical protein